MNRRTTFLILFISIINLKANAQYSIGLSSGLTTNYLSNKQSDNQVSIESGYGTAYNLNIQKSLNKYFNIETGIGRIEKNYNIINNVGIEQKFNNKYLILPIIATLKRSVIRELYVSLSLGGYGSYWLHSSMTGEVPNVFNSTTDSQNNTLFNLQQIKSAYNFGSIDNRFEGGMLSRVSLGRKISHFMDLSAQYEIQWALTNHQKLDPIQKNAKRNITQLFNLEINLNIR